MIRISVVLAGIVATACVAACDDKDADPVRDKLFAAKKAYDTEMREYRKAAGEWFDNREEVARKDGNKKLVDQILVERKAFDEDGVLPKNAPATIKQKPSLARTALEAEYSSAIREYTKVKRDDKAGAIEKQLESFKSGQLGKGLGTFKSGTLGSGDAESHAAEAKKLYESTSAKIREEAAKLIDEREAAERKRASPDLGKLNVLKAEKEALEQTGELPKWIDIKTRERLNKANISFLTALKAAKKSCVEANDDAKAAEFDKQMWPLEEDPAELVRQGSVWDGTKRFMDKIGPSGRTFTYKLVVKEVKGKLFTADMIQDGLKYSIKGEVVGKKIVWVELDGDRSSYNATLNHGKIEFSFDGRSQFGRVFGDGKIVRSK